MKEILHKEYIIDTIYDIKPDAKFIASNNGELLLITKYCKVTYVYKFIQDDWSEILALEHISCENRIRVYEDFIYFIHMISGRQYKICRYDLDGQHINEILLTDKPNTQLDVDSIFIRKDHITYCYKEFLSCTMDIDPKNFCASNYDIKWHINKQAKKISVSAYLHKEFAWKKCFNVSQIKIRCQTLDGKLIYNKDLGIKTFHQVITLWENGVIQICYTDPDIEHIDFAYRYDYHVCYVYSDGTINDYFHSIPKVKRGSRDVQISRDSLKEHLYYSGIDAAGTHITYIIKKDAQPQLIGEIHKPTLDQLNTHFTEKEQKKYDAQGKKLVEFQLQSSIELEEYIKQFKNPLSKKQQAKEAAAELLYFELSKHIIEPLDLRAYLMKHISKFDYDTNQYGNITDLLGVANNILYFVFTYYTVEHDNFKASEYIDILFSYDIESKQSRIIRKSKSVYHRNCWLGGINDKFITYMIANINYMGVLGEILMEDREGSRIDSISSDENLALYDLVEHKGILHLYYQNRLNFSACQPVVVRHIHYAYDISLKNIFEEE